MSQFAAQPAASVIPEELLYGVDGAIATVTLNAPQRMNTISGPMLRQLTEALAQHVQSTITSLQFYDKLIQRLTHVRDGLAIPSDSAVNGDPASADWNAMLEQVETQLGPLWLLVSATLGTQHNGRTCPRRAFRPGGPAAAGVRTRPLR